MLVKKWDASDLSTLWGKEGFICFRPPYGRSSWRSEDSLEIFLSVLKEAKKIDAEGVVSTMLPAGPEALNLEIMMISLYGKNGRNYCQ